jgi:peptidoglycan L-alanyl-D-glutamate endopeptidase CwlK
MASREISMLTPLMITLYYKFEAGMKAAGLPFIITCTARFYQEQVALYAQGRQPLEEVNLLRKVVGLPPLAEKENSYCVTWTLASKHIVNLGDDDPRNDKSRAFDIVIMRGKTPIWDLKANVNANDVPDYEEAAAIGRSVGLIVGADFRKKDYPHFEEPKTFNP